MKWWLNITEHNTYRLKTSSVEHTGKAAWLCPFKEFTAFPSPSAVMWLAEMSSTRSRGMVMAAATSSGRRLSGRRFPESRSSVRLAWSFRARSSGLRAEDGKLRPETDKEELPSCTSHNLETCLFSSAGGQPLVMIYWWPSKYGCLPVGDVECVSHPLPGSDRPFCIVQEEEEDPRSKPQPKPAMYSKSNIKPWSTHNSFSTSKSLNIKTS